MIFHDIKENKMPLIQFNIPSDLNKEIGWYMIENDIDKKSEAILAILKKHFKPDVRQGLKNLMGSHG